MVQSCISIVTLGSPYGLAPDTQHRQHPLPNTDGTLSSSSHSSERWMHVTVPCFRLGPIAIPSAVKNGSKATGSLSSSKSNSTITFVAEATTCTAHNPWNQERHRIARNCRKVNSKLNFADGLDPE
eukprot:scaffold312355_cov39-Tisochrysis_lutea.AAC.2